MRQVCLVPTRMVGTTAKIQKRSEQWEAAPALGLRTLFRLYRPFRPFLKGRGKREAKIAIHRHLKTRLGVELRKALRHRKKPSTSPAGAVLPSVALDCPMGTAVAGTICRRPIPLGTHYASSPRMAERAAASGGFTLPWGSTPPGGRGYPISGRGHGGTGRPAIFLCAGVSTGGYSPRPQGVGGSNLYGNSSRDRTPSHIFMETIFGGWGGVKRSEHPMHEWEASGIFCAPAPDRRAGAFLCSVIGSTKPHRAFIPLKPLPGAAFGGVCGGM